MRGPLTGVGSKSLAMAKTTSTAVRAQMKKTETNAPRTSARAKPKLIREFGGSRETETAMRDMKKPARSDRRWAASDMMASECAR